MVSDSQDGTVSDCSPDGHYLLYTVTPGSLANSIWMVPVTGDRKPQLFMQAGAEAYLNGRLVLSRWQVGRLHLEGEWEG